MANSKIATMTVPSNFVIVLMMTTLVWGATTKSDKGYNTTDSEYITVANETGPNPFPDIQAVEYKRAHMVCTCGIRKTVWRTEIDWRIAELYLNAKMNATLGRALMNHNFSIEKHCTTCTIHYTTCHGADETVFYNCIKREIRYSQIARNKLRAHGEVIIYNRPVTKELNSNAADNGSTVKGESVFNNETVTKGLTSNTSDLETTVEGESVFNNKTVTNGLTSNIPDSETTEGGDSALIFDNETEVNELTSHSSRSTEGGDNTNSTAKLYIFDVFDYIFDSKTEVKELTSITPRSTEGGDNTSIFDSKTEVKELTSRTSRSTEGGDNTSIFDSKTEVNELTSRTPRPKVSRKKIIKKHRIRRALTYCMVQPILLNYTSLNAEFFCAYEDESYTTNVCVQRCAWGHTLPSGILDYWICIDFRNRTRLPQIQPCEAFVDCGVKLNSPGTVNCSSPTATEGPVCIIGCEGFGDKAAVPDDIYTCDIDGKFDKELPFCASRSPDPDLVKPPAIKLHGSLADDINVVVNQDMGIIPETTTILITTASRSQENP